MANIAIYGGTFNPVHIGHTNLLDCFIKQLDFDKIIVIPTNIPPHKDIRITADAQTRLEMCKTAFTNDKVIVSDIELLRNEKSFSYDTVSQLKETYPEDNLFFLMGSDMFLSLETWYRFNDLKKLITFCAVARNQEDRKLLEQHAVRLEENDAKTVIVDIDVIDISSAQIRERIIFGQSCSEFLPEGVENIIREKKLYSFEQAVDFCKTTIRTRLNDSRYHHSLCVAESAGELAKKYGADYNKAYIAGLLHDITKQASDEEQLQLIEKFGILCEDTRIDSKALWHAVTGYLYVKNILGFTDADFLNAIRYHTTSRKGASLLEDVVYIADFISDDRDYPDVDVMREKAQRSLKEAKEYGLAYTIADNTQKGRHVGTNTIEAYNELLNG